MVETVFNRIHYILLNCADGSLRYDVYYSIGSSVTVVGYDYKVGEICDHFSFQHTRLPFSQFLYLKILIKILLFYF